MALRDRGRPVVFGAAAVLLVIGHVLVGTIGVVGAARWLGGIAVGVLVTLLIILHIAALRRLARRRRPVRETHRHGG